MSTTNPNPSGLSLRLTLQPVQNEGINRIAWSPDGRFLASSSFDGTVVVWDAQTGESLYTFKEHTGPVYSVAWSSYNTLSSCSEDRAIVTYNFSSEPVQIQRFERMHRSAIYDLAWSPIALTLASCSKDHTIRTWTPSLSVRTSVTHTAHESDVLCLAWHPQSYDKFVSGSLNGLIRLWDGSAPESNLYTHSLRGHTNSVYGLAWSPKGEWLVSCSEDRTIRIWEPQTGQQIRILGGHIDSVTGVSFSCDGQLLASKSRDGSIRIWRTDTWETVKILKEPASDSVFAGIAFHPHEPVLATVSGQDQTIQICDIDISALMCIEPEEPSVHYTNAKVVLVGDSGVGKSALSLVLAGQPFTATESTHARSVYTFDDQIVELEGGKKEQREIFLWDLAGQPAYRLIHQLHLDEVTIALLVFSGNEIDNDSPGEILYWERALRTAQSLQSDESRPVIKYLIEARTDRGGARLDKSTIKEIIAKFSFEGYFATSAKEGWKIAELSNAIKSAINWNQLPKVTSSALFQSIKASVLTMKEDKLLLETYERLYEFFLRTEGINDSAELRAQFEACIGRIEAQGLIRRLSFGNLILMQPELIDFYASALINEARKAPDSLGNIAEARVNNADFYIPSEGRIADKEKEHLLLLAVIEDLLRRGLVLREQIENEFFLIFPSEVTRRSVHFNLPDSMEKTVTFSFEGPISAIYATLVTRLAYSNLFIKKELWKDAVTYTMSTGGTFGLSSHDIEAGKGEFTLFFDEGASDEARFQFEEYVNAHIERRALPGTIEKTPLFRCPSCKRYLDREIVKLRLAESKTDMLCALCEIRIPILDNNEERLRAKQSPLLLQTGSIERISDIDLAADQGTKREADVITLQGKEATNDFDVFLCHNNADKTMVKQIGEALKERGILPWLDEWELQPGLPWQRLLEDQIGHIKSAAVFVGEQGIGPWQHQELDGFLREFVRRGCPVIPVILSHAPQEPLLPIFLQGMTWVDFRKQEPDPMNRLIWGITGKRVLSV